jgi:5-formyltetrahydrofolate cyclo-ligase
MPKRPIRKDCLQARRQLDAEKHARLSLKIQQTVLQLPEWADAATIALYSPIQNEVATGLLLQRAFADGKEVVFPRVNGTQLQFSRVRLEEIMLPGAFGILEPGGVGFPLEDIDLLLVPGVAFDLSGHRLGYGRGYYDQALADSGSAIRRVGLAFSIQVVPQLPIEGHDVRMDLLITEIEVRRFPAPGGGQIKPKVSCQGGIF